MQQKRLSMFVLLTVLVLGATIVGAQDTSVVLSVSVPDNMEDVMLEQISLFEAQNPGVRVNLITTGGARFGRGGGGGSTDIETYLDDTLEKVTEADVVFVTTSDLTPEGTAAGYFLDLTPLVSIDSSLNTGDFYDPVWHSYQWDGGTWALPVAVDAVVMLYDPAAFDAAGLAYPEDWWSLFELEEAARALVEYDENGAVSQAGLLDIGDYATLIMLNLIGQGVYDESGIPAAPYFENPMLTDLMTTWYTLQSEGLVTTPAGAGGLDFDVPMIFAPSVLASVPQIAGDKEIVALPGSRAGLDVTAFSISAGTQYPETAYALATFLTESPEVANAATGSVAARRSLVGIGGGDTGGGPGGGGRGFNRSLSPELLAIVQPALESGIPVAETRYVSYIADALNIMVATGDDAAAALDEVEIEALSRMQVASDRRTSDTVFVTPPPDIVLATGEVSLNFGIEVDFRELQNEDDWLQIAADFAAFDPEVGHIEINQARGPDAEVATMASENDCFYLSSNAVQGADLSLLLSMDPLMSSDLSFDPNDFAGNILTQVQRNNQTWAMPLMILPEAMLYNEDMFNQTGAFLPYSGWSVPDFENALRTLKVFPEDPEPMIPQNTGGSYLLVLLAAYGGLPVDYSTDPITINFTDPAVVDAAQQVLDLAIEGYIRYEEQSGFGAGRRGFGFSDEEDIALYNQLVNSFVLDNLNDEPYGLTSFPQGTQFGAVSYDIGTAYISANTPKAEACYRFISELTQHPELFSEMPARRSQINDPALVTAQGQAAADFYTEVDVLMSQPNTILFPSAFAGGIAAAGDFLTVNWLNEAFDEYVLNGADLQAELQDAQIKAQSFQECTAQLPPFDPNTEDNDGFFSQIGACASQADPDLSGIFGT